MNLGLAVKSIRTKLGVTQNQLAEICALSQTTLSQIENGLKRPSYKTIAKICNGLDIPVAIIYIVALEDKDVPESKQAIYELIYPALRDLAFQMLTCTKGESEG